MTGPVDALLAPAGVAVAGVSGDPAKHGSRVVRHLLRLGYPGPVWGVNPGGGGFVTGMAGVARTVADVADPVDVLVCAVRAGELPGVIRDAAARGVRAAVVFSAGFAETGGDGRQRQDELAAIARAGGIRLLGPNSAGVICPSRRLALSFLTCLDRPADQMRTGPVGLVTQSGGTGSYLHNLAAERGGGLAVSISTGNEADLGVADAVSALAGWDEVSAIAVVLETVRDGPAFTAALAAARRAGKPVAVCRLGRTERSSALARSHTGALAVPFRVLEGVLDRFGVATAQTPGELLDVAEVLARVPRPRGARAGVVTHSGGTAILLADLAADAGLDLPQPPPSLAAGLDPLLEHGAAGNPADMGSIMGGPGRFGEVVRHFMTSGGYDMVLAVSTPHPPAHSVSRARDLAGLATGGGGVCLVNLWMAGDVGRAGLAELRAAGVAVTEEPRAAVAAFAALARLAEPDGGEQRCAATGEGADGGRSGGRPAVGEGRGGAGAAAPRGLAAALPAVSGLLAEHEAKQLLAAAGIPVCEGRLARSAAEAARAAAEIGFPVVVKVSARGLAHKNAVGGVRLGLRSAAAVAGAYGEVVGDVTRRAPGVRVEGVRVERFTPGMEVLVGCVRDPVFGPMLLLGLGGTAAELLSAVVATPAPASPRQAGRLLQRLLQRLAGGAGGGPAGGGAGGGAAVPGAAPLAALASGMSRLFCDLQPRLAEMEANPVIWDGRDWRAADALIRLADRP